MLDFLRSNSGWLAALGVLGLAISIVSLLALPFVIARLPVDYFEHPAAPSGPRLGPGMRLLRNLLGALVVLAGIAMLVLPGQGLLTLLAGLVLMDFPGKRRLERALVARPRVLAALNWMRRRAGAGALLPPVPHSGQDQ